MPSIEEATDIDIAANFGLLIAEMLNATEVPQTKWPFFKKKPSAAYAFPSQMALTWLKSKVGLEKTFAQALLRVYFDAHLLYSPSNRQLNSFHGENVELHPTPKGFYYLDRWFTLNRAAIDKETASRVAEALDSPYNSLKVLNLERSLLSRRLHLSTGLAMVIWMRMLGESPQIYSGISSAESMSFSGSSSRSSLNSETSSLKEAEKPPPGAEAALKPIAKATNDFKSPYAVRQMIHPNSCCHFQYWNTDGMHLFRDLRFEKPAKSRFHSPKEYKLDFVLSGHALLQWIMDCTSVESTSEGIRISRLLLTNGFLKRIADPVVDAVAAVTAADFDPLLSKRCSDLSTRALYRFTPRGRRLCAWEDLVDDSWLDTADVELEYELAAAQLNAVDSGCSGDEARGSWGWEHGPSLALDADFGQTLSLTLIQREPGVKLLFREELENEHCSELLMFVDTAHRLLLLISASEDAHGTVTRRKRLEKEALDLISRVCKEFIVLGAPYEVNIAEASRNAVLDAAKSAKKDPTKIPAVAPPLIAIKTHCIAILRDALMRFKASEKSREVPGLRAYVVAKYSAQAQMSPSLLARRGAVPVIEFHGRAHNDVC